MKKKKYNIDKSFKLFRYFKTPDSNFIAYLAKLLIPLFDLFIRSDKNVKVIKIKNKNIDNHKVISYFIIPKKLINKKNLPLLIYIHGGGFMFSAVPHQYKNAKNYAINGNCIVYFMKYKLIKPYPASINDVLFSFDFLIKNKEKYNFDISNIGIAGDSAGGFLALDLIKRTKTDLIKFMMLFYPFVDKRLDSKSMKEFIDTPMWNSKATIKVTKRYFINEECPSFNEMDDLSIFPKAYIESCEFDCLRDQDVDFAYKLRKFNKEVILNETKKTMHGFDIVSSSPITKEVLNKRIEVLNYFFNKRMEN